jgi:hypothetical protein
MTDSRQTIPADGITRLTLEIAGSDVFIRWVDPLDEISIFGAELPVDRAGDEIFVRADLRKRRDAEDEDIEIRIPDFESPGQMVEDILKQTGLFSGFWGGRKGAPLHLQLPYTIRSVSLEVEHGDLTLDAPQGKVDCTLKNGEFASSGGDAELNLVSGSGDAKISGLNGSLRIAGGSGDITLSDLRAVTNVKAGSGEVSLNRIITDAIKLAAGSGDVEVMDSRSDAFSCDCGSGDVLVSGGWLNRITVRTGSGDVRISSAFGPHGQSITTGSGSVSLGIPRDLSARIEAFTSIGDVDTDLPLVSVGQRGPRSRRSNRQVGSVGSGEPRAEVSVRTSSGDIRIHWLQAAATSAVPMPPPAPQAPAPPDVPVTSSSDESQAETPRDPNALPDERQAVLDALARGEISIEEADALLTHIDVRTAARNN